MFGEKPPSVEMQALRNIAVASHACGVAVSGRQITVEDIQDIHHTLIGGDDSIAGRLRERRNWMSSKSMAIPLEANYVGPSPACSSSLLKPPWTTRMRLVSAER